VKYFLSRGGTNLRAAEIMWRKYAETTSAALGFERNQLPLGANCLLALEPGGNSFEEASAALESGLAEIYEEAGLKGGVVASSMQQADRIWRVREDTEILYRLHPQALSFDVSVPGAAIDGYVERLGPALRTVDPRLDPYIFGHLADGNLHIVLNVEDPLTTSVQQRVEEILYAPRDEIGDASRRSMGLGPRSGRPSNAMRIRSNRRSPAPSKASSIRKACSTPGRWSIRSESGPHRRAFLSCRL